MFCALALVVLGCFSTLFVFDLLDLVVGNLFFVGVLVSLYKMQKVSVDEEALS